MPWSLRSEETSRTRSAFRLTALAVLVGLSIPAAVAAQAPQISITNGCGFQVWIAQLQGFDKQANRFYPVLQSSNPNPASRLDAGQTAVYTIPHPAGWGGRFWPKVGCDANGANCTVGSSKDGCPVSGCQPPADTLVEFFYPSDPPAPNTDERPNYDISLVDGYTLAMKIEPSQTDGGTCVPTACAMSLASCPAAEIADAQVGDLRVSRDSQVVQCLSPCKKWNYPAPYGLNKPETQQPGQALCCPAGVTPDECRKGIVVRTHYVDVVHRECPTAYSYSYDDEGGLHSCPKGTSFKVTLCPR